MKKIKIIAISLFCFLFLNSYSQEDVKTNIAPEDFPSFTKIDASGLYNLVIMQGETQDIWVKTSKEYKEGDIKVEVKNDVLKISSKSAGSSANSTISVTYVDLKEIELSGVVNLKNDGVINTDKFKIYAAGATDTKLLVEVKELFVEASGAASVKLDGKADTNTIKASGASNIKAYALETQYTNADISGAADARVNAKKEIKGSISGASDLKYLEAPENIDIKASGTADIGISSGKIDTTKFNLGGKELIIIDDDMKKEISKAKKAKSRKKYDGHWDGLDLGLNGYLNSDYNNNLPSTYSFLDLKQEKSWSVGINALEQNFNLIRNHFGVTTGLGFQMNNYRFANNINLTSDSLTIFGFKDTIHNYTKSKLNVNYFTIPLLFEYQTNNKSRTNSFHIAVGGIFGVKVGSHTKMVYTDGDKKEKTKSRDDFHLNPIKYEATVRIGWGKLDLFANYALSSLFEDGEGPVMYPFTAGISLSGN
ncbi:MAG: DUF2807 domain-containing protein [Saprospiraceae bacterium]|nr:DUF2807 domain-containing protein [Saprospiraceae bacterium]